ncbi:MAG TPA: hypothetical protein PLB95_00705 [Syntrophales bacterium]|jgi:hypothetical protein|nr:hypothetical protein [Pseudomonadota bacterium]HOE19065.1 hypothetical protein [Syntrophorhabdaceae bacterium]HPX80391.1 hypothetical protein [Syntrophales bacterium]
MDKFVVRIIRSIRIREDVWNKFRQAAREDKFWMSHMLETMIESYLSKRLLKAPSADGRVSGGIEGSFDAAKPAD